MNIPGYDAYILRGPEEHRSVMMEACEECDGTGMIVNRAMATQDKCDECDGTGEIEVTLDEPDGDYEYERRRDAQIDRG
jgi:DnaJ-class molecular chaperone